MSQLKNIKLKTPTYREIIPSTKSEVSITPFKVGDEKVLLMASESKDSKQIIDSLRKVMVSCVNGVDIDTLSSFDIEYLFIKIRSISVGETADLILKCKSCETGNEYKLDLTKVQVKGLEDFKTNIKITDDLYFEMKMPDMESYVDVTGDAESIIKFISRNVNKVFYGEDVFEITENEYQDVADIIEQLTSNQFMQLQEYVLNIPKLSEDISFACKHCGEANEIKLEGMSDFF